ncbi:hypothetical protein QTP86_007155 [Hemibagrus guttatus]|nr:hypothetical protein QTP86_007155 [Hemibagrus guttatus]
MQKEMGQKNRDRNEGAEVWRLEKRDRRVETGERRQKCGDWRKETDVWRLRKETEVWRLEKGDRSVETGERRQTCGDWRKETEVWRLEKRDRRVETGERRQTCGDWRKETEVWRLEKRDRRVETGERRQTCGDWRKETDVWRLEKGDRRVETGERRQKCGDWRKETDVWRLEKGDRSMETGERRQTCGDWRKETEVWRLEKRDRRVETGERRQKYGDWRKETDVWGQNLKRRDGMCAAQFYPIRAAMDSASSKGTVCPESVNSCNPCLDAAKACNLNTVCKRQRSAYVSACSRSTPIALSPEPCSRKRCHRALRQFFERVQSDLSYPLLFCSCRDKACAERRRQTINVTLYCVRTCPLIPCQDTMGTICSNTQSSSTQIKKIKSRLADFHMNCQTTPHSITSCPNDNYHGCLMSYVGLIGSEVTPNYVDANHANITISPWCSCRGSSNQETECEAFLRDFRENACLRNAIQAFGYGADAGFLPFTESHSVGPSEKPNLHPAIITKPDIITNDVKPVESACVFSTCANLKDGAEKCSPSSSFECADENILDSEMDDSIHSHQSENDRHSSAYLSSISTATIILSIVLVIQVV